MALHFERSEYDARLKRTLAEMEAEGLDGLLIFAQESMYWLTGYDTFGFCFFQCLVLKADGRMALLTRSADYRQAQHTSLLGDIRIWTDTGGAKPAAQLKDLVTGLGLSGKTLGIETETHGLTYANGRAVFEALDKAVKLKDAPRLIDRLRAVKSPAEIAFARKAGELGDRAYEAALAEIRPGADEGDVLAAMHNAIFSGGGDYPANEFIIGSGRDALLCRYKAGRRVLSDEDQINLEFAGTWRRYHCAYFKTICVGRATARHETMHAAAREALLACEDVMRPGETFGDVFDTHAKVMDDHGMTEHRLAACGYSVGARYTPSWMDPQMFFTGNMDPIVENMTLFAHMILMDSETETAMCLGRTSLITASGAKPLSTMDLDLVVKEA